MVLTFPGDATDMVGRVLGPDGKGVLHEVFRAEWASDTNTTEITLKPLLADDPRSAVADEFGELRIVA